MRKTVEVVDDFHAEPTRVRKSALRLAWRNAAADDSPLVGTWIADSSTDEETNSRIQRLLGTQAVPRVFFTVAGDASPPPAATRLEYQGWAGVVWLSQPCEGQGGMSFYRRRGLTVDGQETDEWEETMFIPARFNRLVLFDSSVVYGQGPGFGNTPESGPLSQVILVKPLSVR